GNMTPNNLIERAEDAKFPSFKLAALASKFHLAHVASLSLDLMVRSSVPTLQ
ncbi:Hypothetical predicted protein, partial [Marmota monax]